MRSSRKTKTLIIALYAAGLAALYGVGAAAQAMGLPGLASPPQTENRMARGGEISLDLYGGRGVVIFNHADHANRVNPTPGAPFKTKAGAACSGCHHTADTRTGAPQLWKCAACHRGSGDPKNPQGRNMDEEWSETAFHGLCIQCHLASNKGPTKCGDCHQPRSQAWMANPDGDGSWRRAVEKGRRSS